MGEHDSKGNTAQNDKYHIFSLVNQQTNFYFVDIEAQY